MTLAANKLFGSAVEGHVVAHGEVNGLGSHEQRRQVQVGDRGEAVQVLQRPVTRPLTSVAPTNLAGCPGSIYLQVAALQNLLGSGNLVGRGRAGPGGCGNPRVDRRQGSPGNPGSAPANPRHRPGFRPAGAPRLRLLPAFCPAF